MKLGFGTSEAADFALKNLFKRNQVSRSAPKQVSFVRRPLARLTDEQSSLKRRKVSISAGLILILLLFVSTFFGIARRQQLKRQKIILGLESRVDYVVQEASDLVRVQPSRARDVILEQAGRLDGETKEISDRQILNKIAELKRRLESAQTELGLIHQSEPQEYLDLGLIHAGSKGKLMAGSQDKLVVADPDSQLVLAVSMTDRSGLVLGAGEVLSQAVSVALSQDSGYVLAGKTIYQLPPAGGQPAEVVTDENWQDAAGLGVFAGSLYVFDRGLSEIYKYPGLEAGPGQSKFGTSRRWLKPGENLDLGDAVGLEIDGDVWILHASGKFDRFRQGSKISFKTGLTEFLSNPTFFSVPPEGEKVWILSRQDKRVVALDRANGDFAGQWEADKFGQADGLVVNEKLGKMFILVKEKIYVVEIQ